MSTGRGQLGACRQKMLWVTIEILFLSLRLHEEDVQRARLKCFMRSLKIIYCFLSISEIVNKGNLLTCLECFGMVI